LSLRSAFGSKKLQGLETQRPGRLSGCANIIFDLLADHKIADLSLSRARHPLADEPSAANNTNIKTYPHYDFSGLLAVFPTEFIMINR
jgi:hypothetical protein